MSALSRRTLLAGSVAGGAAIVTGAAAPARVAVAADETTPVLGPFTVLPGDVRYADLSRGTNMRWVGTPDRIRVMASTGQVAAALQEAVNAGQRIAVRSGGHCYEDFVANAAVRTVIDLSQLDGVAYDPARNAFRVEAGAKLGHVYDRLFEWWGVTLPGGSCPTVGIGGHVAGGGYGPLCRLNGLIVDHLYAVEVVYVDASRTVRTVVATREPGDPNADLWWAHTGGGGGNFGIVTRYWFRSPQTTGTDPTRLLPRPPSTVLVAALSWPWEQLTEASFVRLLRNYGAWHEANSGANSAYAGLFSRLNAGHRASGAITLGVQLPAGSGAADLLDRFLAALNDGVGVTPQVTQRREIPWLHATEWSGLYSADNTARADYKSSYHRRGLTDAQLSTMYRHMTRTDYAYPAALVSFASYGGQVNQVAPTATAVAQRSSVLKLLWLVGWHDPADDARHVAWLRQIYSDVFAATGGVPVPNDATDGCFVNYADIDLNDPTWNRSGVPWSGLYYRDNYARLQRAKARWDPLNVFRHGQSVELPVRAAR